MYIKYIIIFLIIIIIFSLLCSNFIEHYSESNCVDFDQKNYNLSFLVNLFNGSWISYKSNIKKYNEQNNNMDISQNIIVNCDINTTTNKIEGTVTVPGYNNPFIISQIYLYNMIAKDIKNNYI